MHHQQTSLSLELPFRCSHKFLVSLNQRWQFLFLFLNYYLAACSQYISPYPLTRSMMFSMANTTTQNAKRIDRLPFVFRTKLFNFVFIVKILIIHFLDNFMTLQNCYEFMQSFAFVAAGFHTCFTTVCSRHIFLLSFPELAQLFVGIFCIQPYTYYEFIFWQGCYPFFILLTTNKRYI